MERAPHELLLTLLEADGVDHRLTLHPLQRLGDHPPVRRVDHHRHPRYLRLRPREVEKPRHALRCVEHRVVHVYVYHLRPLLYLARGYGERLGGVARRYQLEKLTAARHIAPLAHGHEPPAPQLLQSGQMKHPVRLRHPARLHPRGRRGYGRNMFRSGAAAAPGYVYQPPGHHAPHLSRHVGRRGAVASQLVGQSRVGMHAHRPRPLGQLLGPARHLVGPETAVEPHRQRLGMRYARRKRIHRLSRQRAPALRQRGRHYHRQPHPPPRHHPFGRMDRRLRVESVKHRLYQQQIHAPLGERIYLLEVSLLHLVPGHRPLAVELTRHRERLPRRAHAAGHPHLSLSLVGRTTRHRRSRTVYAAHLPRQTIVRERETVGVKAIGLDNIGPSRNILGMDILYQLRARHAQHVVTPLEHPPRSRRHISRVEILLAEPKTLNHSAHSTVEYHHPLSQRSPERVERTM